MFYALTLHKGCLCTKVGLQYNTFHSVNRNFLIFAHVNFGRVCRFCIHHSAIKN